MKKFMKSLMLVAVAAMGFVSCSNELDDVNNQGDKTYSLIFSSEKPSLESESRTEFVDGSVIWSSDDKIRVAYKQNDGAWSKYYASNQAVSENDFKTATFELNNNFTADANQHTTSAYTFYAGYPYNAIGGGQTTAPSNDALSVKVATEQTMKKAGTFDATADIMVGVSSEYNAWPTEPVGLTFARLVAHGCVTLKNFAAEADETVKSVTFTAPDGVNLTGSGSVNFVEQTMTALNNNTVTVNLPADTSATSDVVVWFCSAPATIASGANLTVEVETSRGTYTHTITAKANGIKFLQNRYNTLGINMATATFEAAAVVEGIAEGDYFIVAQRTSGTGGNFFYMTPSVTTTSTKRLAAVDSGAAEVGSVATTNNEYKWTIAKSGTAYTMQAPAGTFVTWTSGNSANLAATGKTLNIVKVEGQDYYNISLVDTTPARVLALNNTSGNDYFAFYESSSQAVNLYLIPAVPADPNAPSLSVAQTEVNLENTECEGTIAIEANNIEGAINVVSSNEDWLVAEIDEDGNLYYIAGANDGVARTATVTLSANGVADVVVTFNQKAAAAAGIQEITVAEFIEKADATTVYQLTGKITRVVNELYGNFDVTDETGTIYVYGLVTPEGVEQTQWAAAGLKIGDTITIQGTYKLYNSTHEIEKAVYVSHVACSEIKPAKTSVSVDAAGVSNQTIAVEENYFHGQTVSVKSSQSWLTVSYANKTLTYSVAENTSTSARQATATLSADGAVDAVITFTQTGVSTESGPVTASVDLTAQGFSNSTSISGQTITVGNATIVFDKASSSNAPAYFTSGAAVRVYNKGTMTVKAPSGKKITNIVINGQLNTTKVTFTANVGTFTHSWTTSSYTDGTWTGSSESVTFTAGVEKHVRIKKVTVTYE